MLSYFGINERNNEIGQTNFASQKISRIRSRNEKFKRAMRIEAEERPRYDNA
jgi:hypothetical protein